MKTVQPDTVIARRRSNYLHLQQRLADRVECPFPDLLDGVCPLFYPVMVQDKLAYMERLSERGDVLGAMETMYQRSKIQEESLHYERLKHGGGFPIVGVNTFLREGADEGVDETPLTRASAEEKNNRIEHVRDFHGRHDSIAGEALENLQRVARDGDNIFEALLATVRCCSLGQISRALYEVGGQYRRNM